MFRYYFFESLSALTTNKLRSFLSILGVLIGVAAVIAMLAMGTGAQKQVEKNLAALGTNVLSVRTSSSSRGVALGSDSVTRLTFSDMDALKRIDGVEKVVPYVSGRGQVVYGGRNLNTSIIGTNADYQYVRDSFPRGRFFTEPEMRIRAKVAVLGKQVADQLFMDTNPIGKWIRINRINFLVIGVLPEKGMSGFRNADDQILMPVTTAMQRLLGQEYISNFDIKVKNAESINAVQEEILASIIRLHRISAAQSDQIEVRNMADIQKAAGEMAQTFALLLGSIAAVSLLVGGIGIMNIMLVMVMERTREIGLRKAIGAKKRDILLQFLTESIIICTFGGIFGILIGVIISWAISFFAGWAIVISSWSIILAFSFSLVIGLIFGLWPAWEASKLQPIQALRYE
ncbi:MAG: macrolide transport system ATP-binding/permease protein [Candidatus Saganbacteria bacterium]|uniref:Macrolide transport system ATP-binding/permease protein n=1 Tax=Candidatus Saganbacteria bacterium TaxID=2575572 RepID=A0A833L1B3_UNCSA|nr:MAG: macrolide transport system ATP-binding/permease protein [Candidatus Saganbacteria bacterium]